MKIAGSIVALLSAFGLSSCVIYLDDPPEVTFDGSAVRRTSGKAVGGATVWVHSKRPIFSLLPVDTFGIVGSTETDFDGRFSVSAKVNWPATVLIQDDSSIGAVILKTSEMKRSDLVVPLIQKRPFTQNLQAQQGADGNPH